MSRGRKKNISEQSGWESLSYKFQGSYFQYAIHHLGRKSYSKAKTIQAKEFDPIKAWWNHRTESDVCWKVDIQTIIDRNFDLDIKNPIKQEETHEFSSAELMQLLEASFAKSQDLLGQLKGTLNG